MESESSQPMPKAQLHELAVALAAIRDSLTTISMALKDLAAEIPSPARDEVLMEVERYLARFTEEKKRDFD